ncbi:MAG: penicillin-binding protein 1C [Salinarimonadaceae bacterium]|nr:MAG: penicillin-binding protein 1C [Salinarimonadaceae bacterium]
MAAEVRDRRFVRRARAFGAGALALVAILLAGSLGASFSRFVRDMGPLDLSVAQERSTIVLDRSGQLLRPFTTPEGRWRLPVTRDDVDPQFLRMLIHYEDRRFHEHAGIDPLAMLRAAGQAIAAGRIVSGGSTLTMQVARLLEPRGERDMAAKLRQVVRAVQLERALSKDEILDLYLLLAPYGGNLEGVRAASIAYFGREPKRLSHAEAALLVALPQSPETRRPDRFPQVAETARAKVLARALEGGVIDVRDADRAARETVPDGRRPFPMLAAHVAEQALAAAPDERVHRLTIDARLQTDLEALVAERAMRLGPGLSGALVVLDNASGETRALVGSVGYLRHERRGAIDMTRALRSPGSALKPFIYALAFESGVAHPETILEDRPTRFGAYAPENFDLGHLGAVTARRALQSSLNIPTVDLLSRVGPARFVARLRQAGARVVVPRETALGLAVGLGGVGVSLRDVAMLYSGLARAPSDADFGASVAEPVAAWYVFDILRGAPPPEGALGGLLAYKTGTSYGFRDAWAVGYDRDTTIAVWVGRADGGSAPGLTGRNAAGPILFDAFSRLSRKVEPIAAPEHALIATTATLPPPLRHIRQDRPKTIAATASAPLRIAFPPDGALVDLGLNYGERGQALALKAQGGAAPFTWLVNGAPVATLELRREAAWPPDGAGFARISVVDANGETQSVSVRLE